jgi:hypothetical protein
MTTSTTNLRKTLVLLAIAATLMIATPSLILNPQLAQARQDKGFDGAGTGQVTCPSGSSPPGNEVIRFSAFKFKGRVFGFWSIRGEDSQVKIGNITGGHIGGKQFTLIGRVL